jgi:hypothetical protein
MLGAVPGYQRRRLLAVRPSEGRYFVDDWRTGGRLFLRQKDVTVGDLGFLLGKPHSPVWGRWDADPLRMASHSGDGDSRYCTLAALGSETSLSFGSRYFVPPDETGATPGTTMLP